MAYEITAETLTEITLTPERAAVGCVRGLLAGMGLPVLLLSGGLLWLRWAQGADTFNLAALVFGVFGAGFVLGALLLKASDGDGPAALVFDQRRAGIWLRGAGANAPAPAAALPPALLPAEGFLPFADVAAVRLAIRSHTSTGTATGRSTGRTTYTYHAALHLHDGGTWTLTSDPQRADAEALVARLQALVAGAPASPLPAPPPPPALPAALARTQQGGVLRLRWRNPVPAAELRRGAAATVFVAGLLAVFGAIVRGQPTVPVFAWGILAVIGLGFGAVVVAQLRRWWLDTHRRYGLDLGPDAVAYVEEDPATGRETLRRAVPRADYYGLSTSYDAAAPADFDPTVLLLSRAAHAQLLHRRAVALAPHLLDLVREATAPDEALPVRVKALGPAQRLALVQWARAEADQQRADN